jgi:hypothetical protein
LIVGIDVHKHTHVAALVDERGGHVATLTFANSPAGYRRLIDWLVDHEAAHAVIGVESPGSYGRCLVAALAGAGFEVLQVPAWRTHRERHRRGPGKTDAGDALSIAKVVLTGCDELGPAEEPEVVRALGMLELQRRRFVRDRTKAIQRLRSDWTHRTRSPKPASCAATANAHCARSPAFSWARASRSAPPHAASASSPAASRTSTSASPRSTLRSPSCSPSTATRSKRSTGSAATPQRSSPKPATSVASATPARSHASAAPHPSPADPAKPQAGTAFTAAATANSTPPSTASRSSNNATTPRPRPTSPARSPKARPPEKPAAHSNATSPTSSTATSRPGPTPHPA